MERPPLPNELEIAAFGQAAEGGGDGAAGGGTAEALGEGVVDFGRDRGGGEPLALHSVRDHPEDHLADRGRRGGGVRAFDLDPAHDLSGGGRRGPEGLVALLDLL
jgi:hypothetical protein